MHMYMYSIWQMHIYNYSVKIHQHQTVAYA